MSYLPQRYFVRCIPFGVGNIFNSHTFAIIKRMSVPNDDLRRAVEFALADKWDAAHQIVQQYDDGIAAWIHAVLHKIEGDSGNARYWYRRADRMDHVEDEPHAELAAIKAELTTDEHRRT